MKQKLLFILFLLSIAVATGSAFIEYFVARSDSNSVRLEWKTSEERGVKEFAVERKTVHGNYMSIGSIQPKGDNSVYSFLDENIYKTSDNIFKYRLKIVDTDNGVSYSKEISVSHKLSDIKRTWGSIKAMFR